MWMDTQEKQAVPVCSTRQRREQEVSEEVIGWGCGARVFGGGTAESIHRLGEGNREGLGKAS